MAAGFGSRYGGRGLKQIDPIGANGEIIMDYSLYDAQKAGFKKAVFVIKEESLSDFQEILLPGAGTKLEIEFVFQRLTDVPEGERVPEGREKPWGTGHAVRAAAKAIHSPFAVVNADDFYGREAFEKMYRFLTSNPQGEEGLYAMVAFQLQNTITEYGYVSRGICETEGDDLKRVVEREKLGWQGDHLAYWDRETEDWCSVKGTAMASMNFYGFTPSFFTALDEDFAAFFRKDLKENPLGAELYLPFVVDHLIRQGRAKVRVLSSGDKWYGVTYAQDKARVMEGIQGLVQAGLYPEHLWREQQKC